MSTIKHTAVFDIDQPVEILFPLFSAEGEKLWVPGWDYENIMGSSEMHEDYIFLTKTHDHASTDVIWLQSVFKIFWIRLMIKYGFSKLVILYMVGCMFLLPIGLLLLIVL